MKCFSHVVPNYSSKWNKLVNNACLKVWNFPGFAVLIFMNSNTQVIHFYPIFGAFEWEFWNIYMLTLWIAPPSELHSSQQYLIIPACQLSILHHYFMHKMACIVCTLIISKVNLTAYGLKRENPPVLSLWLEPNGGVSFLKLEGWFLIHNACNTSSLVVIVFWKELKGSMECMY